ncbi:MAG: S41 family peptidase [Dehalococcoidia bacterium]|nr:S41 family peptidase [Dehalococcoidia bacterium]
MPGAIKSILLVVFVILPLALGCAASKDNPQDESFSKGMQLVGEAWEAISEDYVDSPSVNAADLAEGAIRGLMEALNDPYTNYLDPEQYKEFTGELEGEFSGIGVYAAIKDGYLTVVVPIAGSPAEQAGVRPDDRILEVDGEATLGMTLEEAVAKIRGEKGTKVRLLMLHPNHDTPTEIEIIRDDIKIPSVEWEMLPGNIAHIKVTRFSDRTDVEFASALEDVVSQSATGIVLDLRDNPGGFVEDAVSVVDEFVDERLVVYALDNKGKRTEWLAEDGGLAEAIPLAVLVNNHSASASEVVAGALQDYGRGEIIGVKTFGKGSMNYIHQLSNGGAIYLTFAYWYTPDGRQISGEGIIPDIIVEMPSEDTENSDDLQLERAIELLMQ